jgi:hypothetical protein
MPGRWIRVLGAAAVLATGVVDEAAAQAPPTFGGGGLPAASPPRGHYLPTVDLALQPQAGGRIGMLFDSTLKCGGEVTDVLGSGDAAWNGTSFRISGHNAQSFGSGRLKYRWTVKGQVSGDTARGTLRITGRTRSHTCRRKPNRAFVVRVAGPRSGAPAKPARRAFYVGTSNFPLFKTVQAPVMLRATKDARKIAAEWTMDAKCTKGAPHHFLNFTPAMRVRADGTFSRTERFSVRYIDGLIRYRPTFAGRITADGATGTLRLRARIFNRKGTKLKTRCDSGVIRWNAAPA